MSDLSVIILTFNEELHIERCIGSILPVSNNIHVIDSFSTDRTLDIVKELGVSIYQREWRNYAEQFQWALDNCPINTEWVMRIDADEALDETLQKSLISDLSKNPTEVSGFICSLRNVYLGKRIRFGGYDPLKLLRVWRYSKGRIENRWMDEHIVLDSGVTQELQGEIIHNNLNSHSWWTSKHNSYADREMLDIMIRKYRLKHGCSINEELPFSRSAKMKRFIKNNVYNNLPLFVRATMYFSYRYVVCLGFLDGKQGFAYHFFQAYWYRAMVDVRVLEAELLIKNVPEENEKIAILRALTGLDV